MPLDDNSLTRAFVIWLSPTSARMSCKVLAEDPIKSTNKCTKTPFDNRRPPETMPCDPVNERALSSSTWTKILSADIPRAAANAERVPVTTASRTCEVTGGAISKSSLKLTLLVFAPHTASSHGTTPVGAPPGHSAALLPRHETRRVRGPQTPSQADHSPTSHLQPEASLHSSASAGRSPSQPLASPQGQLTARSQMPEPQDVEQLPQAEAFHVQPLLCKHACCRTGPEGSEQPPCTVQDASRCCEDSPQRVPHSDQALASQPHPSVAEQGRDALGELPLQWMLSPPGHQTSRCCTPLPHNAEHALHGPACHVHVAYELHIRTARGGTEPAHSASRPPEHATARCCMPEPQELLQRDHSEVCQVQDPDPRHSRRSTGLSVREQSASTPLEQATLRFSTPSPHCVLQPRHSLAVHSHAEVPEQASALTGASPEHPAAALHVTLRTRWPLPQVELHSDQAPIDQSQATSL
mmetsp:Transcript_69296/g.225764  ORF Transcript_69296/g.225764 Transcript_69296/m.225764 type:complete len:468 (+) Transcript_69296:1504-2907(+)